MSLLVKQTQVENQKQNDDNPEDDEKNNLPFIAAKQCKEKYGEEGLQ